MVTSLMGTGANASMRVVFFDFDHKSGDHLVKQADRRLAHFSPHCSQTSFDAENIQESDADLICLFLRQKGDAAKIRKIKSLYDNAHIFAFANAENGQLKDIAHECGADDFSTLPIVGKDLATRIEALFNDTDQIATASISGTAVNDVLLGKSTDISALQEQISRMAQSSAPIFLTGAMGTGKEKLVHEIHNQSPLQEGPIVLFQSASIPDEWLETELCGQIGDASQNQSIHRMGSLERADGGTLYIDDICDLDAASQAALLRYLESGIVQAVGSGEIKRVDVRIVASSGQDPLRAVQKGILRADLYYRINVLRLHIPKLSERLEDISDLAQHCVEQSATERDLQTPAITASAIEKLKSYHWPGNLSELHSVVQRAVLLSDDETLDARHIQFDRVAGTSTQIAQSAQIRTEILPFHLQEREIIERAIATFNGNITRAAAALEISASTIHRKRQGWMQPLSA